MLFLIVYKAMAAASPQHLPLPGASGEPGASELADDTCEFKVVSFNFGFAQWMMAAEPCKVQKYCGTFVGACGELVEQGNADLVLGCEVGGFRQGFKREGIDVGEVLQKPFGETIAYSEMDNFSADFLNIIKRHFF